MHKITAFLHKRFHRNANPVAAHARDGNERDSGGGGVGGGGGMVAGVGDGGEASSDDDRRNGNSSDIEMQAIQHRSQEQELQQQQQHEQQPTEAETIDPLLTQTENAMNMRNSSSNGNNNNNNNINSINNNNNSSSIRNSQQVPAHGAWQYHYFVTEEHKIHWFWAPAFLALWVVLYLWIIIPVYSRLPTPLTVADALDDCGDCFIAERAEYHLSGLTAIGSRPLGGEINEQETLMYFKRAYTELRSVLDSNVHELDMDVQLGAGNFVQWDQVQAYEGIQNIVMRLRAKTSENVTAASLLVNSHYDTVPHSPGASDSAVMIAIMLEILYVLCRADTALMHPVVFLFNGAGENAQLGVHAFITQHPWAQNVRAAINLDSAGSGGREILFQSGPRHPWLVDAYQRAAKHPFASTLAEELFQRNIIHLTTDLDILYEHGRVPGLDFTYHYNGYVYHTAFDRPEIIPSGTLQNTGDNILALVREIANTTQLQDAKQEAKGHMIYFDLLGLTLITYDETTGIVFNVFAALTTIIACCTSFFMMSRQSEHFRFSKVCQRALFLFILQIFAVLLAGIMSLFMAILMDFTRLPMVWFTHAWLILGLYYCPLFAGYTIVIALYFFLQKKDLLPIGFRVQMLLHCHCMVLAILTLMLTLSGVRSAFALSLILICYTLALVFNLITGLHNKPTAWILPHTFMCIFPFLFYAYLAHGFYIALIPMTGWMDPTSNPDLIIISFTLGMGILTGGFIYPIVVLFDKSKTVILTLLGLTALCVIIAVTPLGFPFRPETHVQRLSMLHTTRIFHDANNSVRYMDSGYFILPQDHRSYVKETCRFDFMCKHVADALPTGVINGTDIIRVTEKGQGEMFYGLPLYTQYWHQFYSNGFWLPAEDVHMQLPPRPQLNLTSMVEIHERSLLQYELTLSGLAQMSIYIRPLQDAKLVAWCFNASPQRAHWRPPYIVNYAQGTHTKPLQFSLEFKPPTSWRQLADDATTPGHSTSQPIFEIGIAGHWTQHQHLWTDEFQQFVDSFPEYVDVTAWPATYEVWQF